MARKKSGTHAEAFAKAKEQVAVEEPVAEIPEELWEDICFSVLIGAQEIKDDIESLKEVINCRERAYVARSIWEKAIKEARNNEDARLGALHKELGELKTRLENSQIKGGVKVPLAAFQSFERKMLTELFNRVYQEETRIKIKVAVFYGFKNEAEVTSIINKDQKAFNEKGAK